MNIRHVALVAILVAIATFAHAQVSEEEWTKAKLPGGVFSYEYPTARFFTRVRAEVCKLTIMPGALMDCIQRADNLEKKWLQFQADVQAESRVGAQFKDSPYLLQKLGFVRRLTDLNEETVELTFDPHGSALPSR